MASLGQLTAGIAHEINNPINFVSGSVNPLKRTVSDFVQLINKYETIINERHLHNEFAEAEHFKRQADIENSAAEADHLIHGIEQGASRTAEIVKGLRNFSRLEEQELKKSDLNEAIDSTLLLLGSRISEKKIVIERHLNPLPKVEAYHGQLNQVWMNILSNSIEAVSEAGRIEISTSLMDGSVRVSIKDNGKGMSNKVKGKIFDPFFTTKDVGKGTGLGLSIAYQVIEMHHGKIQVESEEEKGSEFIITLPISLL